MLRIDVFSAWLFVVIESSVGSEGLRIYFESVKDGPEMEVPYECQTATMHEDYVHSFCDSCRGMCREDPWLSIFLIRFLHPVSPLHRSRTRLQSFISFFTFRASTIRKKPFADTAIHEELSAGRRKEQEKRERRNKTSRLKFHPSSIKCLVSTFISFSKQLAGYI